MARNPWDPKEVQRIAKGPKPSGKSSKKAPAEFSKTVRDERTWYGSTTHTEGRKANRGK